MLTTLTISEGTQFKALTESTVQVQDDTGIVLITFADYHEMEKLEDCLSSMAREARDQEFKMIGEKK